MSTYSVYLTASSFALARDGKILSTSAAIADALAYIYDHKFEDRYLKLYVTRPFDDAVRELWIRPLLDQFPYKIDPDWELVGCEAENIGRAILIVPIHDRGYMPTGVILERRTGAES